ncbi:SdrD B-like domain-containing protein [Curtobacterium herbarum]|uniref:SD-repeat containing protein B domain-containing protein n=1 Tax=Curtobacterium herbarum TaxID=150122 RepID=A0ABP4KBY7_9MICO|nr:SdrD B-like domain-containing protein [Curtobacterium herbarum]MBM7475042.1 hypothetical protein [Curtobacterium herbarum]MCS6545685.1 carboxypeptidase regulatory-like domain-containing protein [Curtobacterium herbarum]
MRPRATPRAALALAITLAVTSPSVAAAATSTDPPASTTGATVGLAVEIAKDGNGPFTPDDGPGGDRDATNGIVRTLDAVTYRVTMNSTGGTSTNERFTLSAPAGTSWVGVPGPCRGAGSSIDGADLVCNLGDVAEGHAVAVPAVLDVSGDLRHGDTLAVAGTGTADGAENGTVTTVSPTTTVSAAPRYNLSKNINGSRLDADALGPDGTTHGIQLVYPITVDWQPVVPGQGLLGFERSAGPMTFTDDLSEILGDLPSDAVLWNGGHPACGVNDVTDWRFGNLPGGRGGTANSVTDSGAITCEQDSAGEPVSVTITGTVTDPTHLPTTGLTGALTQPNRSYFVSGYLSVWMPTPPPGTSVDSVNTYSPLRTTSISGAPNFPGSTEPLGDNRAARNIVEFGPGGGYKRLYRVHGDGASVSAGSAREGDPWVTPGMVLRSDVGATNTGLRPRDGVVLCDTFDRATQRLTRVGPGRVAARTAGLTGGTVQYAAYDMTSPEEGQRQATCDDDDGPWYDQPEDVPGGLDAVGAIRATGGVRGSTTAVLFSYVVTRDVADGTRARDFGHLRFGADQPWIHDTASDPVLGAGSLSDSVLVTEDLARVTKKVVDAGHDATDTPDATRFAVAGNTLDYALYPSLTNGNTTGKPSDVTVRDVLPPNVSYVADSATPAPETDTITDADGAQRQRLTWTLHDVDPNTELTPITYTAEVSTSAPAAPVTNEVVIASPSDRSDERYRRAERAVQIVTTGGVGVRETALEPVVVTGDDLRWQLDYTNTDASAIDHADLIDVLPFRGAGGDSSFHGSVGLAAPIPIDAAADESVEYTAADPGDVALDGSHPSNQPGGSTNWCAEADFGTAGCPGTLADVTAFRLQRGAPVAAGATVTHRIALRTDGQHDGDRYTNRFGLRASNLALAVLSNAATVRVVAGALGDHVWTDEDGNGIQDAGETGLQGVDVRLTGTDDHGDDVDRTTTTTADGDYRFGALRPGAYTVTFRAPEGRAFTRQHAGTDQAVDSDVDQDGRTAETTIARVTAAGGELEGVQRLDTIDAGVLPANDVVDPPGTVDPGFTVDPTDPAKPVDPVGPVDPDVPGGSGSVSASPAPEPGTGRGSAADATTARGTLAFTGSSGLLLLSTVAMLLVVVGGVLVWRRRLRRR